MATASTLLMILAIAFFSMGVMDYYSATQIEDKEFENEMKKMGNHKQSLIGGGNGVEDSLPDGSYNGAGDPENNSNRQAMPAPGERAQIVASLSNATNAISAAVLGTEDGNKQKIPEKKNEIKEGLLNN